MQAAYNERFRPQFHFSPARNWMNDPHGLIYHDGEYHLFYQHNAEATRWGPMSWGHAISEDLVTWHHLPIAIPPDTIGGIWTGSVVYDGANTCGRLPDGGLVAVYSYEDQSVGVSYSADRGRNWTSYEGNPVIPTPGGSFRDPQIFWFEASQRWHMAIACEQSIQFFESSDLYCWSPTGEFSVPGGEDAPWEVPDLFPLGDGETQRWVLLVSMAGAPAGGPGMRYFIGDFDGRTFRSEMPMNTECWLDHGPDNYAGSTWKNLPGGRRVYIGWMNNWRYAEAIPTQGWRGALTLPRELRLVETATGFRLYQNPLSELTRLRSTMHRWENQPIEEGSNLLEDFRGNQFELQLELQPQSVAEVGIRALLDDIGAVDICYNAMEGKMIVDRTSSGLVDFHDDFALAARAPLDLQNDSLRLHVFVDRSSVEVFANDGKVVLSNQVFPNEGWDGVALFTHGGTAWLESLTLWPLNSTWGMLE